MRAVSWNDNHRISHRAYKPQRTEEKEKDFTQRTQRSQSWKPKNVTSLRLGVLHMTLALLLCVLCDLCVNLLILILL